MDINAKNTGRAWRTRRAGGSRRLVAPSARAPQINAAELDALLPSILDHAFKGEL